MSTLSLLGRVLAFVVAGVVLGVLGGAVAGLAFVTGPALGAGVGFVLAVLSLLLEAVVG